MGREKVKNYLLAIFFNIYILTFVLGVLLPLFFFKLRKSFLSSEMVIASGRACLYARVHGLIEMQLLSRYTTRAGLCEVPAFGTKTGRASVAIMLLAIELQRKEVGI